MNSSLAPKILCISLGSIGQRHLKNARSLLPNARLALYRQHTKSTSPVEGVDQVCPTYEQTLAFAPDAVLVSSPASEHLANAREFIRRGVPVFIEKPLAATAQSLGAFVSECKASHGFTMVGYVLRFLPALQTIKKLIDRGDLGRIYITQIQVGQYLPDWRPAADYRNGVSAQKKLGGGALLELSHELDYATWLLGWPASLQCSSGKLSDLEIDVEDSAQVLLEYPRRQVHVQLDFLQRVPHMEMQLVGEKASLRADLIKEELMLFGPEQPAGRRIDCAKMPNGNEIYLHELDFFFTRALSGYRAAYPRNKDFSEWAGVEQAARVLQLVDLAKQAAATGARQTFKPEVAV